MLRIQSLLEAVLVCRHRRASGLPCPLSECSTDAVARPRAAAESASLAGAELQEALGPPQLLAQPPLVLGAARHLRLQQVAVELHLQDGTHAGIHALQLRVFAEPTGGELQKTWHHGFLLGVLIRSAACHQALQQAAVKLSLPGEHEPVLMRKPQLHSLTALSSARPACMPIQPPTDSSLEHSRPIQVAGFHTLSIIQCTDAAFSQLYWRTSLRLRCLLGNAESSSTHHQCMALHLREVLSIEVMLLGNGLPHLLRWRQL